MFMLPVKALSPFLDVLPESCELIYANRPIPICVKHANEQPTRLRIEVRPV